VVVGGGIVVAELLKLFCSACGSMRSPMGLCKAAL
jgi:hypothetical protein